MPAASSAAAKGESRFRMLREIGAGSSGTVHVVLDRTTHAQYVMKRIPTNTARLSSGSGTSTNQGDDDFDRVMAEVRAMVLIDHPNVVRFKTSFVTDADVCIVMEKCEGSLADIIDKARSSGRAVAQPVLIEWFTELLCAVSHLHSKRIMHRDIKPSNVFLSKRNHVKLGDFGVCKHTAGSTLGGAAARSVIGTPHYLAPEVLDGEPYDQRADVWSLGVLFYELCALRLPFAGDNFLAVVTSVCAGDYAPLPSSLDRRFAKMIGAMLEVDPTKRITVDGLLNGFLKLPKSHPSHPSQQAHEGRAIQRDFGPSQIFETPETPESAGPRNAASPTKFSRRPAATGPGPTSCRQRSGAESSPTSLGDTAGGLSATLSSERSSGGASVAVSDTTAGSSVGGLGDSPPRGAAAPKKATSPGGAKQRASVAKQTSNASPARDQAARPTRSSIAHRASPVPKAVPARSPAANAAGAPSTPSRPDPRRRSPIPLSPFVTPPPQRVRTGLGSAISSTSANVMTPEEHHACLSRIRNAKSRVDISHLRKAMKGSRSEESTDTPIFVPGSLSPMRSDGFDQTPPPLRHADPTNDSVLIPMDEHNVAAEVAAAPSADETCDETCDADDDVGGEVSSGPARRSATPPTTEVEGRSRGQGSTASRTFGDPSTDATSREADCDLSRGAAGTMTGRGHNAAAQVTALLEGCSKELSLEDMDDVLEAVRAFKLARFGPC